MVTPNPGFTSQVPGMPPVVSDQPILALSLKTFGLGGAPNAPSLNTGVPNDAFQRTAGAPAGSPQQQLQQAYMEAEAARNKYLGLANQLNSAAYQNQLSPQTLPGGSVGQPAGFQPPVADPNQAQQQMQQMQQQLQAEQQAALAQQQQAAEQARLQAEQQMQQQQMLQAQQQAGQPPVDPTQQQQQAVAGQPPIDPTQQQLLDDPLDRASIEELNGMIAQGQGSQAQIDAMAQLTKRGNLASSGQADTNIGNAATYELLKRVAAGDPQLTPPGNNYARQAAFWTLGTLDAVQNAEAPNAASLPSVRAASQVIGDNTADPSVKIAAIQALQVSKRLDDETVKRILKKALKDGNPDVKLRAQSAAAGETIPLGQGATPQAMPQQPQLPPQA